MRVVTADRENYKHLCSYIWEQCNEHDVHYTAHVNISSMSFCLRVDAFNPQRMKLSLKMQGNCLRSLYFEVCFEIIFMTSVATSDAFLRALEARVQHVHL